MKRGSTLAIISLTGTFAGYIVQTQTTPEKSLILLLLFTILLLFVILANFFKFFVGHFKK